MQRAAPVIPERTSSKAAIEARSLHIQASRDELKRRLSQTSFEQAPIRHQKLRIEDLELQREEQKVHKLWLDDEYELGNFSASAHRSEHKKTNERYVSLGSQLWNQKEILRAQEEKNGRVEVLGPDVTGAFVATLLALYKDPNKSRKRSSHIQSQMKETSIAVYEAAKGAPSEGKLWCCITRNYYDRSNVKAAHIVPFALRLDIAEYMFGKGSGTRLDTSDNCLLMHFTVEQAFDNGCFVLLPVNPTEVPILRWKIQMTNSAAVNRDMGKVTLRDIDGQEVIFKNDRRPASRFLYYHFVVTLLRNKRDRQPSWEKYFTELPTGRPFTTMGRYLRSSMLLALARSAGDLDAEEEARILSEGGEHTFVEEQKLDPLEEAEVAQLALGAYGVEDEDEDEDED